MRNANKFLENEKSEVRARELRSGLDWVPCEMLSEMEI
jgi:hypothetical protein